MAWHTDLGAETAIVTGGSRNIGLAIAAALRDAGARVCVWGGHDRDALASAVRRLGGESDRVMGLLVPVQHEDAVISAYERVEARLGAVTILVNNAAARPHGALVTLTREAWQSVLDVILTGAFLTSRELFRRLPPARLGAIVNIGGLSAHRPVAHRAHVIAAKAGLVGLTRALAEEGLGRIRVNCVVPGAIATERHDGQRGASHAEEGGRSIGSVDDVARSVLPLADPSEQYVTGQTLHVSGGRFVP